MRFLRLLLIIVSSAIIFNAHAMQQNINAPQNQQQLLNAIQNKDIGQVQSLLQAGINPNFELGPLSLFTGNSPISVASIVNNADIMQLLLQYGANPNRIIDTMGNIALTRALTTTHGINLGVAPDANSPQVHQDRIIKMLLANPQLNINYQNNSPEGRGSTVLMTAIRSKPSYVPDILAHPQLDINAKNTEGETALMLAIALSNNNFNQYYPIIEKLVSDPRLDVNIQDNLGRTALMRVIQLSSRVNDILKIHNLLNRKPLQINLADKNGMTALDYALRKKNNKSIVAALGHNASSGNPERRKMPGGTYTPFEQPAAAASSSAQPSMQQPSATATSGTKYHARTAPQMPQMAAQPSGHAAPAYGYTPPSLEQQLYTAVLQRNVPLVADLLKRGANPNATYLFANFDAPIFHLALGFPEIIKLFLAQKAFNPNAPISQFGSTALTSAIQSNFNETVLLLINDPRTNLNVMNVLGLTPLDIAIQGRNKPLYAALLAKGAKSNRYKIPQAQPVPQRAAFAKAVYDALGVPQNANPYAILGIAQNATDDEVRQAYRTLTVKWHPDKNPDKKELAGQVFSLITIAYQEIQKLREKK